MGQVKKIVVIGTSGTRVLAALMWIVVMLFSISCSREPRVEQDQTLVIVHTNDIHGHLKPSDIYTKDNEDPKRIGGLAYIATLISQIRKEYPDKVLLLDGGDTFSGTSISNLFKGRSVIEVMNCLNYDAMTIGNHDFDFKQSGLEKLIQMANFPVISANIVYKKFPDKRIFDVKPYIIKEVGNIKVGILGLATPRTFKVTLPENVEGLKILSPIKTAKKYIPEMKKEGAEIIIVISQLARWRDDKLAKCVPEIDVIIGGQCLTEIMDTMKVRNTLIVQAGSRSRYLGKLVLKIDPKTKKIKSYTRENERFLVLTEELKPDPEVQKIIEKYEIRIEHIMKKVIAKATTKLSREWGEGYADVDLGSLLCDSFRRKTGADVVIINQGAIKDEINKGNITVEDAFKVFPYQDSLVTMELSGRNLKRALESGCAWRTHHAPQVSGLTYSIDFSKPRGSRTSDIMVNGKPLEKDRKYRTATLNFTYLGGDGYNFKDSTDAIFGSQARAVFIDYITEMKIVSPSQDRRIKILVYPKAYKPKGK
ncbi:MAG: bifunctional metallophosphatase/5'-nucleotidase [Candidatus Eremiobacteraeota bacterium]|nr:bifunctional metallophosphatase/5'-nucleotidase [Candidatus Eremiobacteraeota bacterium]